MRFHQSNMFDDPMMSDDGSESTDAPDTVPDQPTSPHGDGAAPPPPVDPRSQLSCESTENGDERSDDGAPNLAEYIELYPHEISECGPLLRSHMDRDALDRMTKDYDPERGFDQAIGVREEVGPNGIEYLLVFGRRRLYVARNTPDMKIRVRNYGKITVAQSLELQARENGQREDLDLVDIAVGDEIMVKEGRIKQAHIARITGRKPPQVSVTRAVGEAIRLLSPEEKEQLRSHPEFTYRMCQCLAAVRPVKLRVKSIRLMLTQGSSPEVTSRSNKIARIPESGIKVNGGPNRQNDLYQINLVATEERLLSGPEAVEKELRARVDEQLQAMLGWAENRRREAKDQSAGETTSDPESESGSDPDVSEAA